MTCAGSLEKRTSWAVPVFLGVTQRVPIAVVVALTGEHFGFVMLAFFSVRFCSGNDRWDLLCWRCFFSDRRDILLLAMLLSRPVRHPLLAVLLSQPVGAVVPP